MKEKKLKKWKDIPGYEGLYCVSKDGEVYGVKRGKLLKPFITEKGYALVDLYKNNVRKHKKVHRLVALAFIPNPDNKEQINHIDFDKLNNKVSNLEWCTNDENQSHAAKMRKEI